MGVGERLHGSELFVHHGCARNEVLSNLNCMASCDGIVGALVDFESGRVSSGAVTEFGIGSEPFIPSHTLRE